MSRDSYFNTTVVMNKRLGIVYNHMLEYLIILLSLLRKRPSPKVEDFNIMLGIK